VQVRVTVLESDSEPDGDSHPSAAGIPAPVSQLRSGLPASTSVPDLTLVTPVWAKPSLGHKVR
jgi:hypothetical protein